MESMTKYKYVSMYLNFQIIPIWIIFFDQSYFPFPIPVFKLFFRCYCVGHSLIILVPDKSVCFIFFGKSIRLSLFTLCDPLGKIRGHSYINCSVTPVCQKINSRLKDSDHPFQELRRWIPSEYHDGMTDRDTTPGCKTKRFAPVFIFRRPRTLLDGNP